MSSRKRDPEKLCLSLRRWLSGWNKFSSNSQSHNKPVTLLKANFYKPWYPLIQGTKEMDVVVQVKFFVVVVVFLIHLILFAIVSEVTDVMF